MEAPSTISRRPTETETWYLGRDLGKPCPAIDPILDPSQPLVSMSYDRGYRAIPLPLCPVTNELVTFLLVCILETTGVNGWLELRSGSHFRV
jgi:hypothetical protein